MEILMVGLLIVILVVLVKILERLKVIEKYWLKEKKEQQYKLEGGLDDLIIDAARVAVEQDRVSPSTLQRKLSVGYARAARILDQMHQEGLVDKQIGATARVVYKDKVKEYLRMIDE